MLKVDVLQTKVRGDISRAQFAGGIHHLPVVGVLVFQSFTGFTLLQHEHGVAAGMFRWIVPLMGGRFVFASGTTP